MAGERTYMLRFGELALKGRNQKYFVDDLVRIVKPRVAAIDGRIERGHKRLLLHTAAPEEAVRESLSTVFGIVGVSPIWRTRKDMDAIRAKAWKLMAPYASCGKTFAVKARRGVKEFPLKSPQIQSEVGAHLLAHGLDLEVNLKNPDLTLSIVIDPKQAWLHLETWPGLGGLPIRVRDKMVLLLSGGIDSPVAGHLMQKRGAWLNALYFHTPPYTVEAAKDKVIDLAQVLAEYQNKLHLHVVNFTNMMQSIRASCRADATVVLSRRFMMRAATRIIEKIGAKAIVTGESLGQVASQTIENIGTIGSVVDVPVLRPLIGLDKREIIDISRRMGAYDISIRPEQDCCTLFSPKEPMTKARGYEMEAEERRIDGAALLDEALELTETIELFPSCRQ